MYEPMDGKEADVSLNKNPCYGTSSDIKLESMSSDIKLESMSSDIKLESATSPLAKSKSKKPVCSLLCMCALVGFVLVGSAAFAGLALTVWNSSQVNDAKLEMEHMITQLKNSLSGLDTSISEQANVSRSLEIRIDDILLQLNHITSELERRLTRLQIIENNCNDIQSNISKSLNFKLNNIIRSLTGQYSNLPADSCSHVLLLNLFSPSGHYWIRSSNGSAVRVYCDMTRSCGNITGGWMGVASLNWSNESLPCPDGFRERNDSGIRTVESTPHQLVHVLD